MLPGATIYLMSEKPKNTNLVLSILVLLVAVLVVSIVGLVSYFAIVANNDNPVVVASDGNTTANPPVDTRYPLPVEPRQDVSDWSDLTGEGISKIINTINKFDETQEGKATVDRCAYMVETLDKLRALPPAPVESLEEAYRAWLNRLYSVVFQCSETINLTQDFSAQTKQAVDKTVFEFGLFQLELSKYVDLERR